MSKKIPIASIIIPTKNEEKLLPRCLYSLTHQKITVPYEIIIVDSNSTDRTVSIARHYKTRIIHQPKIGKVYAFQKGADEARGSILCFTEADCIVPPNWISTITNYLSLHPDVVAISGYYTFYSSTSWLQFLIRVGHPIANSIFRLIYQSSSLRCSNFAIHTSNYRAAGGFISQYKELYDVELGIRIARTGKIHHVPTMTVQTSDRRFRGRIFQFLTEFIPSFLFNIVLHRPLSSQIYKDIR